MHVHSKLIKSLQLIMVLCMVSSCSSEPEHQTIIVEIKDMKFVPEDLTINRGDTIIWVNKDMMAHDVTEENSKTWTSGPIAPSATWKTVPDTDAAYYCSIHTVMKGKIRVE